MIGIYCLLSVINDKVYIGQSVNIEKRIKQHISDLTASRHRNSHLQRAFDKYGLDNFVFSPMLKCDENKLDYYEIKYISDFDSTNSEKGYNLESGGNLNKRVHPKVRKKMSESRKGMVFTEEHKRNISLNHADQSGENNPLYGTGALDKVGGTQFIKSEIANGNTQEAIAKKAGVSGAALRNYLKVRNLSWEDLGGSSKTGRRLGTSIFDELGGIPFLKSEICNGKSQADIAREANVYRNTVFGYLKRRKYTWDELKEEALSERE